MSIMEKSTCATLFSVLAHGYRWNTIPSPSKEFNLDHLDLPRGLAFLETCIRGTRDSNGRNIVEFVT